MTRPGAFDPQSLSIVVPVFDEEANVTPLVWEIRDAVAPLALPFEILLVDDGSRDGTLDALRRLVPEIPELVVIALRRNFGQTLALQAGLDRARGDAVVTLDGDRQNDPRDIPALLAALVDGADVVSGWRQQRQDGFWLRLLPSWIANRLIRRVTGVPLHDQGCALKAYRRDVVERLDLYGDMHRYVALLTIPVGAVLAEIPVRHHPRTAGVSKYGLRRTAQVLADLISIQMLTRFRENPLRWFAIVGSPFLAVALLTSLLAPFSGSGRLVLATVALLCTTTFGACLLVGLLGQTVIEGSSRTPSEGPRLVFREWSSEA